ncbi:Histone-lysine N-methyltransferase SETDB2 [Bienertia sinuspersici]
MGGNLEDPIIPESEVEDEIESVDATDKGKKVQMLRFFNLGCWPNAFVKINLKSRVKDA